MQQPKRACLVLRACSRNGTRSADLGLLCSDVICDYPLKEMLAFHRDNSAEGTILVTQVSLPAQAGSSAAWQVETADKQLSVLCPVPVLECRPC